MEGGGGVMFPVVFFDGENDINLGPVKVGPSMEYKSFQHVLSQIIGISPNQISIYLIDRKKSLTESHRRRIPITGKTNFAVISREKDCSFLAVLKRARKNRRSKPKPKHGRLFSDSVSLESSYFPADKNNFFLLRRDSPGDYFPQVLYQNPLSDFNGRKRELELIQRQNYNRTVLMNSNPASDLMMSFSTVLKPSSSFPCEECNNERFFPLSTAAEFHCCVDDAVIFHFRSPVGPIARPLKPL